MPKNHHEFFVRFTINGGTAAEARGHLAAELLEMNVHAWAIALEPPTSTPVPVEPAHRFPRVMTPADPSPEVEAASAAEGLGHLECVDCGSWDYSHSYHSHPPATAGGPAPAESDWHMENASVEVMRWGASIRLAIRSEHSIGKAIELTLDDARDLVGRINQSIDHRPRRVRDDPVPDAQEQVQGETGRHRTLWAAARPTGTLAPYCDECSQEKGDYVWPCRLAPKEDPDA